MWSLDEELDEWFENVEFKREQKYNPDAPEEPAMVQNEYARGKR